MAMCWWIGAVRGWAPGDDRLVLFKCWLIGPWHGLSAPKLERALKMRLDFMLFCGLGHGWTCRGFVPVSFEQCLL